MLKAELAAVLLVAAGATACAERPERPILGRFFASSRLADLTALGGFATVWFDPRTDGIIIDFDITRVDAERRRRLTPGDRLIELSLPAASGGAYVAVSKEVTISAPVRLPGNRLEPRTVIVTMERAGYGSGPMTGRWIITGFRQAPARS